MTAEVGLSQEQGNCARRVESHRVGGGQERGWAPRGRATPEPPMGQSCRQPRVEVRRASSQQVE